MLTLLEKIISFLLGGKATITIKNTKTGGRFTFEVIRFKAKNGKKEEEMPFIVKVLSGPNNESDFRRLGMIFPDGDSFRFVVPAKWEIGKDAQSAKAFDWFFKRCMSGKEMPECIEVRHDGRCGRCRRKLTTPESIDSGLGPICAKR